MAKLSAGYSGTPLLQKLGIKEDMKVKLIGEPMNYFDLLEKDIAFQFLQKKMKHRILFICLQKRKIILKQK